MVNRVQSLRSTVAGARPANRSVGEIYANFSDLQLGVMTGTGNTATDLLPVRYFSTLASYAIGDHVVQGGEIYKALVAVTPGAFNPAQWAANAIGAYLELAGGTMLGPLVLAANAAAALEAVPLQQLTAAIAAGLADYLPLAGGTLTGPLIGMASTFSGLLSGAAATFTGAVTLSGNAGAALQAVPLQQLTAGLSDHLPLAGGDLTGPLTGTDATFSGDGEFGGTVKSGTPPLQAQMYWTGLEGAVFQNLNTAAYIALDNNTPSNLNVVIGSGTARFSGAVTSGASPSEAQLSWAAGYGAMVHNVNTGNFVGIDNNAGTAGIFNVSVVNANKVGGGDWGTFASDARVKTVLGDYTPGLDEVLRLRPVSYVFNGNDTPTADVNTPTGRSPDDPRLMPVERAPYPASIHYAAAVEEKPFVGFIAQEVEQIFPDMVTERDGYIDGQPVDDLRGLDTSALIYALVNAIKTLAARVEALEGGL